MKHFKNLFGAAGLCAAIATLASCNSGSHTEGVALEGTISLDSIEDFVMVYNEDGDISRYHTIELTTDKEGNFQIPDSIIPEGGTHVQILADERGFFGAWLEPVKTAVMEITAGNDGKGIASFSGDNSDINTFFNDMTTTLDIMVFSPQDPSERMPYDEAIALLNSQRERLDKEADNIKDNKKREYYKKYATLLGARMMGFIIEDKMDDEDASPYDDPEYQKLVEIVDPEDDASLESGMIYLWLNSKVKDLEGSPVDKAIAELKAVDAIKNKRTHKALYNMVPHNFFAYNKPTIQEAADFMKAYGEMAKEYPEFIDTYALIANSVKEIKAGDKIAYDPEIVDVSGNKCKLSDLFGNDIVYIDFWATWCGPCCKQIPHLEKMIDRMKDVKGIKFVSISSDSDSDAWKAKLAKDNPEWPQYIFSGSDGDKFMTAMNITGIPRFMIIGKNGVIISPDAPMPSDPDAEKQLRELAQ